jgi:alpha-L-fucosidase 2
VIRLHFFPLVLLTLPLAAAPPPQLWYTSPAADWSQALPIGNGRLAAMVFGGVSDEHLQLNEETIFAGKSMDRVNPAARASLPKVRQLLLAGKVKEAEELAAKDLLAIPLRQPPYQPLGDLIIHFEGLDNPTNYRRNLDLYDGIASVTFDAGGNHLTRESFASYPDGAIIVHFTATDPIEFSVALTRPSNATTTVHSRVLFLRGTALPPKTYTGEPDTGATFEGAVKIVSDSTVSRGDQETLRVTGAKEATLILVAATDVRYRDPLAQCRHQLQLAQHPYSALLARHRTDFRKLSTRVALSLGADADLETYPTNELLERAAKGGDDRALTALYFAFGRYLLQSSSRENSIAANLQGKWNDKLDPPWGSKYTININTEMNYWPAEVTNLGETVDGLYNLLARMQPNGQRTAQEMYGTAGFVAHHNTEVWADTEPIDGVPYGIWPDGAAWLSLSLWDHYEYSGDLAYLRLKAYPMMRDAALYLVNNLFPDGQGHLVSGPSLSPENEYFTADHQKASLDLSPTFDIELTTALFHHVITAGELLHTDAGLRARLSAALPKLMPLQIGKYGQLQEWRNDYEEVEPGHRHLSHLFAVYPSGEINPSTPDLYRASRVSLERRLANGGGGTGWSRAWVVCLWATYHEAEKADESLRVLYEKSTWPNLFDLHPPEIFQIDGNLGATAGIAQMLVQSRENSIELLPAVPVAWKDGSVTGLRAHGGVTLDFAWHDGRVSNVTLHASKAGSFKLNVSEQPIELRSGETRRLKF